MAGINDKYICYECIGDPFVRDEIILRKEINRCSYCGKHRKCIALDALADWVDEVYCENYQPGDEYPVFARDAEKPYWESAGEFPEGIISEMLVAEEDVACDLVSILSARERFGVHRGGDIPYYDGTSTYENIPVQAYEHSWLWREFCEIVKHRSRFFSEKASALLNDLFEGIAELKCSGDKAPIRVISENDDERFVYRARRAISSEDRIRICLNPSQELGPPPSAVAVPGRMNPAGIPVFYGAFDRETCLAEIRLAVGEVALSCKFELMRPLHVLDLTVFSQIHGELSFFDPAFKRKASWVNFLTTFEAEISKPILPHEEVLEYIPTQALVEYFANFYEPRIDAVIYSSTQMSGGGQNIAILNHAIRNQVANQTTRGASNRSHYEEDWHEWYSIRERKSDETKRSGSIFLNLFDVEHPSQKDPQEHSLRLVPDSIRIHRVRAVQYDVHSTVVRVPSEEGQIEIDH